MKSKTKERHPAVELAREIRERCLLSDGTLNCDISVPATAALAGLPDDPETIGQALWIVFPDGRYQPRDKSS